MSDDRERVRDANPIADVIQESFPLQPAGQRFKALCPFHKEKTPSFTVDPDRGTYKCFGCGEQGDVFSFVMKTNNMEFREALEHLAQRAGITLERSGSSGDVDLRKRDLELLDRAAVWFERQLASPRGAEAREYLVERGFTPECIEQFRIGFAPPGWQNLTEVLSGLGAEVVARATALGLLRQNKTGDRHYDGYRNRVIFPIRTSQGRVVGFGGRVLASSDEDGDRKEPKYINSPESPLFKKGELLYGHFEGRDTIRRSRRLLLMEGYTDVMMAHQAGFAEAVATLGTALAEPNVDTIARHADHVVLLFDGDEAGRRAGLKALRLLLPRPLEVRVAVLPGGVDPCDAIRESRDGFASALETAQEGFAFVVEELARAEGVTPESAGPSKERVARAAFEFLALVESEIRREAGIGVVANRLGVTPRTVASEFARFSGGVAPRPPAAAAGAAGVAGAPIDRGAAARRRPGSGADQEWILLGALAKAEWAKVLLRLHPPQQFGVEPLGRIAERLLAHGGSVDPVQIDDPGEKSTLLELHERLEQELFDEERATRLVLDLLVRLLEGRYETLASNRGRSEPGDGWSQPDSETKEQRDRLVRESLELRREIDRLKGLKQESWNVVADSAERWLADSEADDLDPVRGVVTPAGDGHP